MLDHLIVGLTAALQLKQFMFMVLGTVIGLWVGVLPGLGGPVAMAILIPFTFSMDPLSALLMLASISVGAAFGGSVTSILLNIPGEASSAATAYDGYPMAQRGKAKVAMGLSAGASMAAAIAGVLILMFASGPVAKAALAFSPAEYFALAILGLTVVSVAALGSTIKGLAMGALGIAISLIGVDSILGSERYTFGSVYLLDGISFVPVMVGLFALTELSSMILEGGTIAKAGKLKGSLWDGFWDTFRYPSGRSDAARPASRADAVHLEPGAGLGLLHGAIDRRRHGDGALSGHDPLVCADHHRADRADGADAADRHAVRRLRQRAQHH